MRPRMRRESDMKTISEVLKPLAAMDRKEAVRFLRTVEPRYHGPVRAILKHMFDPKIKFALPDGAPPYKRADHDSPAILFSEVRRFYLWVEGGFPGLSDNRRQELFQVTLEALPPGDAELLLAMKDKKPPWPNVDAKVVLKAFPGLF